MEHSADILLQFIEQEQQMERRPDAVRWTRCERPDGRMVIMPSDAPPFLFRGQTSIYLPCYPSICRGFTSGQQVLHQLPSQEQLTVITHLTRAWWFSEVLRTHPAMRWASEQHIHIDEMAVAQHYGIPTGYMDVTESVRVAAFFATCRFRDGQWQPMTEGVGVIYRVPWGMDHYIGRVRPIGLQPFPRPAEQWAWTVEMILSEDFGRLPYLQGIRFRHSEAVSRTILDSFSGGADLFPPDVMARVADHIKASSELPLSVARAVVEDLLSDDLGLRADDADTVLEDLSREFSMTLTTSPTSPLGDAELVELERSWETRRESFYRGVGVRFVRTPKSEVTDAPTTAA
jgi:hypothetical protein